jgi:hypothetical protein
VTGTKKSLNLFDRKKHHKTITTGAIEIRVTAPKPSRYDNRAVSIAADIVANTAWELRRSIYYRG